MLYSLLSIQYKNKTTLCVKLYLSLPSLCYYNLLLQHILAQKRHYTLICLFGIGLLPISPPPQIHSISLYKS